MKAVFLILLILGVKNSYSQSPGYLGKKLSISYTPALFLSLQPKLKDDLEEYKTVPGLNFRNDFTIDYVLSKSVSLGGSIKYLSTKMNDAFYHTSSFDNENPKAYSGDILLRGPAYSIYIKKYAFRKKGFIAPVGFYSKWELFYSNIKVISGDKLLIGDPEYQYVNSISEISTYSDQKMFGLIYSYGRQNFITDQFYINTSSSLGISNLGISSVIWDSYTGDIYNFESDVKTRLSGYLFINFNIGVGVLL